jgi:hypothetical protein
MKLKYVGKGSFLVGVPARDLNTSEAKKFGIERLLNSNLYEEIKRKPKVEEPADDIQQEA